VAALKIKTEYIIGGLVVIIGAMLYNFKRRLTASLSLFIPQVEGFRSTPYWDESRYSWGYGTAAPGETGTIDRGTAFLAMLTYLFNDYESLSKKITRPLTVNQWTALLSFSYNLGIGDAYNLVPNINDGAFEALGVQWNEYIHAGGVVNDDLVARRAKEWALWNS
jgi:lysozyme